jgi:hypothetical protein
MTLILTDDDVAKLLPMADCVEAMGPRFGTMRPVRSTSRASGIAAKQATVK